MPKVRKTLKKEKAKQKGLKQRKLAAHEVPVPDDDDHELDESGEDGDGRKSKASDPALSRGQRKREKKKNNFMQKYEFMNLVQKADEAGEAGLADLKSLVGGLEEVEALSSPSAPSKDSKRLGRKAEMAAHEREMAQFQGVVGFKAFQDDPFGALEQHLKNSIKRQKDDENREKSQKGKKVIKPEKKKGRQSGKRGGLTPKGLKESLSSSGNKLVKNSQMMKKKRGSGPKLSRPGKK
eukprot:TRINITY_DN19948_c0_g7_i1.p1 TRINITY_DN19948_c0_g7~~TRINITY_DN19948_c0_g7_i1.p1  ORF type:complete len:237 (-),score=76.40 TRINITY_DN19948_c0_g7_i1:73-783(-)